LSYSARCFTARALDVAKDQCGFRCIEHPDGLPLATREEQPFLTINGIQIQSHQVFDLCPELPELREAGIDILRLYPQIGDMAAVVNYFDAARRGEVPVERRGARNGYWEGSAGMESVNATMPI